MSDDVTVITLTRGRPEKLCRAIASVRAQDHPGPIVHRVVVDDCPETMQMLAGERSAPNRALLVDSVERAPEGIRPGAMGIRHVYPWLSRLLNGAVRRSRTRWIAFLDDDNAFEPQHVGSLLARAAQTGSPAVHSFRTIWNADGSPYLQPRFPWAREPSEKARIYELMCERGVWVRNTNVLRDRAGPAGLTRFVNSTVLSAHDPVFMVDTSVWLLDRTLLAAHPIPETYSEQDVDDDTAPDDKLLEVLLAHRIPIVASGLATLRYYLGGISN